MMNVVEYTDGGVSQTCQRWECQKITPTGPLHPKLKKDSGELECPVCNTNYGRAPADKFDVAQYDGQEVTLKMLEGALDFIVSLRPMDPASPEFYTTYHSNREANKQALEKAEWVLRKYGEQLSIHGLEKMQSTFHLITHSFKYSTIHARAAVKISIEMAWHKVDVWRKSYC